MGKTERLAVFMNCIAVGHLDRIKNGALLFKYEQTWLARNPSMPISRKFPLQEQSFEGKLVQEGSQG